MVCLTPSAALGLLHQALLMHRLCALEQVFSSVGLSGPMYKMKQVQIHHWRDLRKNRTRGTTKRRQGDAEPLCPLRSTENSANYSRGGLLHISITIHHPSLYFYLTQALSDCSLAPWNVPPPRVGPLVGFLCSVLGFQTPEGLTAGQNRDARKGKGRGGEAWVSSTCPGSRTK